jgi:hypothetical protein
VVLVGFFVLSKPVVPLRPLLPVLCVLPPELLCPLLLNSKALLKSTLLCPLLLPELPTPRVPASMLPRLGGGGGGLRLAGSSRGWV